MDWESSYELELENFLDHGDMGEIWFGENVMRQTVKWVKEKCCANEAILDIGCGNAALLLALQKEGFDNLTGCDYSEKGIDLASVIVAQEQIPSRNPISLHTCDILEEREIEQLGQGKFGLILDKGTYDAIRLSPQDSEGKGETYVKHVAFLNRPGGLFLITSYFQLLDQIPYPQISFVTPHCAKIAFSTPCTNSCMIEGVEAEEMGSCIQGILLPEVVSLLGRQGKQCVMRIQSSQVHLIMLESGAVGGVLVWAELDANNFFSEYNMDGVTPEHNEILLEFETGLFLPFPIVSDGCKIDARQEGKLAKTLSSFKSSQNAKSVKLKLTKKHSPCLTLEIELASALSLSRICVHDIPVGVLPRRLWSDYSGPPDLPVFDASVSIPSLKPVRSILDRMKNLSQHLIVSGNSIGNLCFRVETNLVSVKTVFTYGSLPQWERVKVEKRDGEEQEVFHGARIDIKKLNHFVCSENINFCEAVCSIVENQLVHLALLTDSMIIQCHIPAMSI
ncbi:unnamed protein product [Darwinula stevensoni]|uniref:Methyltransferase domain-containing protein n=1 Tax=Darwinula stevensoni TaxID=69355 RepID=A0A7R8X261_9CRUS|nr:unnamed protein product [Darwinula stevensoni]CAG0883540.1 unnamed protein product [Darwinula stevensoni]